MFYLDYYYVDVGENYCLVDPRNVCLDLIEAYRSGNKDELKLARELIVHKVKRKAPIISEDECIVVCINKRDKRFIHTEVEEVASTSITTPAVVENEDHDVYLVRPGQQVVVECSVNPYEVECRVLKYKQIKEYRKKKNKFQLIRKRKDK